MPPTPWAASSPSATPSSVFRATCTRLRNAMVCKPRSSYEEGAMLDLIARRQADIAALCRRFGVRRLTLFGSAARETDFDAQSSDVDFLVEFDAPEGASLAQFLDLRTALEE